MTKFTLTVCERHVLNREWDFNHTSNQLHAPIIHTHHIQ